VLATASGAAGGTFGLAALPVELPVSTVIMLRSIADIARSEGEDLSDPETALACVEVFALGGRAGSTDASESGYFAVRSVLAKTVAEAARFVAERVVIKEGAPILLKFVTQVAARFGLVVTQKVAAQALPVVGALGGAALNCAFMELFRMSPEGISRYAAWKGSMARTASVPNTICSRAPGPPVKSRSAPIGRGASFRPTSFQSARTPVRS
jgi:EcsC protein family